MAKAGLRKFSEMSHDVQCDGRSEQLIKLKFHVTMRHKIDHFRRVLSSLLKIKKTKKKLKPKLENCSHVQIIVHNCRTQHSIKLF